MKIEKVYVWTIFIAFYVDHLYFDTQMTKNYISEMG